MNRRSTTCRKYSELPTNSTLGRSRDRLRAGSRFWIEFSAGSLALKTKVDQGADESRKRFPSNPEETSGLRQRDVKICPRELHHVGIFR